MGSVENDRRSTTRAANSVYLGNRVASQKKVLEPKTRKKEKKKKNGREMKRNRRERVRRKESGGSWKRMVKKRRNQKSIRGQKKGPILFDLLYKVGTYKSIL